METGSKTEKLYGLWRLVRGRTGIAGPLTGPMSGDWLYNIESGVVTMFHRRCKDREPLEYLPFAPELVGRPGVEIALGKGSGLANIEEHLEKRGRTATPEQSAEILARVKAASLEKRALLSGAEFDQILTGVVGS